MSRSVCPLYDRYIPCITWLEHLCELLLVKIGIHDHYRSDDEPIADDLRYPLVDDESDESYESVEEIITESYESDLLNSKKTN